MGEYAVDWHRSAGFAAIQFNAVVSTNTAAITLWKSLGFETIGGFAHELEDRFERYRSGQATLDRDTTTIGRHPGRS